MAKTRVYLKDPAAQDQAPAFVLGRQRFEQISRVDGIVKSAASQLMFEEFDRKGLSPAERREAIFQKYARKA